MPNSVLPTRFIWLAAICLGVGAGCQTTPPPNSLATHDSSKWEKDMVAFEQSDKANPPPKDCIVFVGSSSIKRWTNLAKDFPDFPVINRGFGGSQLADSVKFTDRIIIPYAPRQVVIYAGGNDLNAKKSPEMVFGDFVALVTKIRAALPHARIAFISSAPNPARWAQIGNVRRFNALAKTYCQRHGLDYIDVHPTMMGDDGMPKRDIYVADRLHMNEKGYALWREVVVKFLR